MFFIFFFQLATGKTIPLIYATENKKASANATAHANRFVSRSDKYYV